MKKTVSKFKTATDTTIVLIAESEEFTVLERFIAGRETIMSRFKKPDLAIKYFGELKKQLQ